MIELLVVTGIIALISLVTIPLFVNYQKDAKLKNEARLTAINLRLAQQLAVTEQIIYNVVFNSDTDGYQIINSETSKIIKTVNFDPEINIAEINSLTDDTVRFNATGSVLEAGTVLLTNSRTSTSTIQIKPSGYIQIND